MFINPLLLIVPSVFAKKYIISTNEASEVNIGNFHAYTADLTEEEAEILKTSDGVIEVEEDQEFFPTVFSWGLDRINQRDLPLDGDTTYTGDSDGVNVYVIDTGIDTANPDFGGRAIWGSNFVGDGIDTDCHGHGTHVAGTIGSDTYGIAKKASLIAVKVFGCSGGASTSTIIAAIDYATADCSLSGKRCIINMSLGGGASASMNAAVAASIASGVHNIVAAGNDNIDACLKSPASAPDAITVGSTTISDSRSSFSNWGSCVDIFAPGSGITSWDHLGSPWTISGTSMATPHVSGIAARLLGETAMTPAEMVTKLSTLATTGKVTDPKGSLNLLAYLGSDPSDGDLDAPDSNTLVFYYEVTGEELETAQDLGFTTFVPTAAQWASMTTDNFKTYRGIVFGDPHCHGDEDAALDGAEANKAVWSSAIDGNILIHTFDPSWHKVYGSDPGTLAFLNSTVEYIGGIADKTGFYMSTSCYHFGDDAYIVTVLSELGLFVGSPSYYGDDIHIVDTAHPSLLGSTDSSLSFWGSSVHNYFTDIPSDYKVIAIAEHSTGEDFDGVLGYPVLIVKDSPLSEVFTCTDKPLGYQECKGTEEYYECDWFGYTHLRPVAPGTDCCNWAVAQRIIMVGDGSTCPF